VSGDPWERRPNETSRAYEAFCVYLAQPTSKRNYRAVAQELNKSASLIGRWGSQHDWPDRVAAWDADQQRVWLEGQREARRQAAERRIRAAQIAQNKAAQALVAVDPAELSVAEMVKVWEAGVKIERDAYADVLGAAHGQIAVTGPGGDPLTVELHDFTSLPPDQRARRLAELTRQAEARAKALTGEDDD
jgi:hypothetical protein